MPDDTTASISPWDWDQERVTVGRHFLRDLEGLWSEVLKLAAVVEESLDRCLRALRDGRVDQAQEVKRQRRLVDRWEVRIEQECIRVLALHQPVASDLRRVAAVLKINGDLERLAELARHIAKRVKKLAADPRAFPIPQPLEDLALAALAQVHHSLDALTHADVSNAQSVIQDDQSVDLRYRAVIRGLKQDIIDDPERIDTWLRFVNTARNLERIADHGAKIAEAVVYLKEGEILPNPGGSLQPGGVSPRS
jgi:phosphate transport system protein